jgi:transcriptional regulator GlxA family with amidase domain
VALYPGFQALDVFGPLDVLNVISSRVKIELSIVAATRDPVSTKIAPLFPDRQQELNGPGSDCGQSVLPTHTFASPPQKIDVLLVPGGVGNRDEKSAAPVIEFIRSVFPSQVKYLITVCTGSAIAAQAGVLDGKRATTNKRAFDYVVGLRKEVDWVRRARWVVDGNIWTSSGISAGIDVMFAFVEGIYGRELAHGTAKRMEYVRNENWEDDPFA